MTIEEAIKWIQEEKASFERAPDLNGCLMTEYWQKAIDALDIAISALRQQDQSPDSGKMMQREPMTNADRLNAMTIEGKAEFLYSIAYGRETPWSKPFLEKFCKACPVTKVEIPDYLNPLFLHECDFTDGKCPHGSEIVWWLKQPVEEYDHACRERKEVLTDEQSVI